MHRNKHLLLKIIERFDSQCRFSASVEENEAYVSRAINNHILPSAEKRKKWAEALACEVRDLPEETCSQSPK